MSKENQSKPTGYELAQMLREEADDCERGDRSRLMRLAADEIESLIMELRDNARLRGAMARLCRAVSHRMMPDEPTPEHRMELREAFDAAQKILGEVKYE